MSVANSQSLRLNLLNTTPTTATCQANIDLVNENGLVLGSQTLTLGAGQSAQFDASTCGLEGSGCTVGIIPVAGGATHQLQRLVVRLTPTDPCRGVVSTLELFDLASRRTALIASPWTPHPLLTLLGIAPRFGLLSTAANDTVRLHLVNTAEPGTTPACQATVGFRDASGAVLQSQTVSLLVGSSVNLDQPGGPFLRPFVSFVPSFTPLDPCRGAVTTVEVVDQAADTVRSFVPTSPIGILGF